MLALAAALATAAFAAPPASPIHGPSRLELREREDARQDAEATWKPLLDRALELSKDPDRLKDALDAYELAIDELPPYSESVEVLGAFSETFYDSLLRRHPEMGGEAGRFFIGRVAGPLMLLRPQGEEFRTRRFDPIDKDVADSARLEEKERRLTALSRLIERANAFVGRPPSQSARAAWQRVDAVQPGNWEARFYLAQLPLPAAVPAPKKVVTPAVAEVKKIPERRPKRKLRPAPRDFRPPEPVEEPPAFKKEPVAAPPPAETAPVQSIPEGAVPLLGDPAPH